jgi:hypothetical protein
MPALKNKFIVKLVGRNKRKKPLITVNEKRRAGISTGKSHADVYLHLVTSPIRTIESKLLNKV